MLIEKNLQQVLSQLTSGRPIHMGCEGSDITIRLLDQDSKLSLTSLVYEGGNYIPSSVRRCLSLKSPFSHPMIRTFLTVDENHFQVKLNYLGHGDSLDQEEFKGLLEEFSVMAHKWRVYLDEHDKNDLIHVRVK